MLQVDDIHALEIAGAALHLNGWQMHIRASRLAYPGVHVV